MRQLFVDGAGGLARRADVRDLRPRHRGRAGHGLGRPRATSIGQCAAHCAYLRPSRSTSTSPESWSAAADITRSRQAQALPSPSSRSWRARSRAAWSTSATGWALRARRRRHPLTSVELAERTGLDERWVREWAYNQAAAKLIDAGGPDGNERPLRPQPCRRCWPTRTRRVQAGPVHAFPASWPPWRTCPRRSGPGSATTTTRPRRGRCCRGRAGLRAVVPELPAPAPAGTGRCRPAARGRGVAADVGCGAGWRSA